MEIEKKLIPVQDEARRLEASSKAKKMLARFSRSAAERYVVLRRKRWREQTLTIRTILHLPINQSGQMIHDSFCLELKKRVISFKIE
jgi:hypothetical protein